MLGAIFLFTITLFHVIFTCFAPHTYRLHIAPFVIPIILCWTFSSCSTNEPFVCNCLLAFPSDIGVGGEQSPFRLFRWLGGSRPLRFAGWATTLFDSIVNGKKRRCIWIP